MPKMMGTGRRNRAASIRERICVLSPISARPTTMVETRKASTNHHRGRVETTSAPLPAPDPVGKADAKGLAKPGWSACAMAEANYVDANPAESGRLLPNDVEYVAAT